MNLIDNFIQSDLNSIEDRHRFLHSLRVEPRTSLQKSHNCVITSSPDQLSHVAVTKITTNGIYFKEHFYKHKF